MRMLLLLFAALMVAGCGEKSSSEGSESASESVEPSADTAKPPPAEPPVAESASEEPSETPNSLSDDDVERLLKEAVDLESLEQRNDLFYQDDKPYSGWAKEMYVSGQVQALGQLKDGKTDGHTTRWYENGQKMEEGIWKDRRPANSIQQQGPYTAWHDNGQKSLEVNFKDDEPHGLAKAWHENGQKLVEGTYKDGEEVSVKYWNSKGEEVETEEEAYK